MKTRKSTMAVAAMAGLLAGSVGIAYGAASSARTDSTSGDSPRATLKAAGQNANSRMLGDKDGCAGKDGCKSMTAGTHDCKGKNDCKGQGGCKSGDNGCKGKNTCKSKGGCSTASTTKPG